MRPPFLPALPCAGVEHLAAPSMQHRTPLYAGTSLEALQRNAHAQKYGTDAWALGSRISNLLALLVDFACFTSTKVHILTQTRALASGARAHTLTYVPDSTQFT